MLPGPFQAPSLPGLPTYIPPLLFWLLVLAAAVAILISLYRFFVAEPSERVNAVRLFFVVILVVLFGYLALMNGPEIAAWFRRLTIR